MLVFLFWVCPLTVLKIFSREGPFQGDLLYLHYMYNIIPNVYVIFSLIVREHPVNQTNTYFQQWVEYAYLHTKLWWTERG